MPNNNPQNTNRPKMYPADWTLGQKNRREIQRKAGFPEHLFFFVYKNLENIGMLTIVQGNWRYTTWF